MKPSGIGGQAVIEGVMMRNQDNYAVAVRKPNHEIVIKKETSVSWQNKSAFFRLPIVRGVVAFLESMVIGMKTLTFSAGFYEEDDIKPTKMEQSFHKVFKEKAESVVMGFTVVLSIVMAVGIFMILPFIISNLFHKITENQIVLALIEGAIRLIIFIAYVIGISLMKDIKRVFMYHGAEHKTINCVENGLVLTVSNVRKQSKHHKRCGTSFLFIVMFISIIFFIFIRFDDMWLRLLTRVLLVPVIAGISYEFIRLAGKSDSAVVSLLSKPGMWMQALTTREPEDAMIEVAIASVDAVFDWKEYQIQEKRGKKENQQSSKKQVSKKQADKKVELEKTEQQEAVKEIAAVIDLQKAKQERQAKSAIRANNSRTVTSNLSPDEKIKKRDSDLFENSVPMGPGLLDDEEEDDEILSALDKYFVYEDKNKE